ncbi:GGDEF domain-containing protein [Halarcobacter bivalviorum]|uniref:GGDEF domain-containing protein n=1 Tax=Halarcobacter bivalviorum TaxID=663364 RepID=UPI00100B77B4|nr:GGDEF domain-containing protein [Halarcobacter bivalviorum]RXK07849.1 GGDEF domain-containing protein [Halarcobacter bivalviorum]
MDKSTKEIMKITLDTVKEKELPLLAGCDNIFQTNLQYFVENLSEIIMPSIDFNNDDKINSFIEMISKNPVDLLKKDSIDQLIAITKNRVNADRQVLKNKTDDIIKLSTLMEKYFDKTILESSNASEKIENIKNELQELNISNSSQRELGQLQSKLIDTIYSIENSMQDNRIILGESKQKFNTLNEKIDNLQKELAIVKKEKSIDFLTSLLNRRAYEEEVKKIEKKHEIFNSKYAIVFYDIDHFKQINDTYGHSFGDTVLKTFGSILKSLTRKEDTVARYGGEEFIALINYEEEKELYKYIKRVKTLIDSTKFKYRDISINIEFSAGVSFRYKYESYLETKKKADTLLYQAKKEGRDRVIFDNNYII